MFNKPKRGENMRSTIKYTVLTILFSLFLMQAFVYAQKPTTKDDTTKNSEDAAIIFPDIKGWTRGDITTFPTAELGYSIGYESREGGRITVYVFDMGEEEIADGVESDKVKAELAEAERQIQAAVDAGYYADLVKIKSETITLGGKDGKVKSLYTRYGFTVRGNDLTSEIYVFGYKNNFIKFRATRPKEDAKSKNKAMKAFHKAMNELFSK